MDYAGAAAGAVTERRADRQVGHAVAVDVAYSAHAKEIECRGGRPAEAGPVHFDCPQDRAVPAHEQRVQRGPYVAVIIAVYRAGGQVGHAVAVDVADQGHRRAGGAAEGKRGRRGRRPVGGLRRPDRLDFHAHAWRVRASAPFPLACGAAPDGTEPDLNARCVRLRQVYGRVKVERECARRQVQVGRLIVEEGLRPGGGDCARRRAEGGQCGDRGQCGRPRHARLGAAAGRGRRGAALPPLHLQRGRGARRPP